MMWVLGAVGCECSVSLPDGYYVFQGSKNQVVIARKHNYPYTPQVLAKVIGVWWNDRFIVAKRNPLVRRSPERPDDTTMIPDETIVEYWIIDTGRESLTGPLTKSELEGMTDSLGIEGRIYFKTPCESPDAYSAESDTW